MAAGTRESLKALSGLHRPLYMSPKFRAVAGPSKNLKPLLGHNCIVLMFSLLYSIYAPLET